MLSRVGQGGLCSFTMFQKDSLRAFDGNIGKSLQYLFSKIFKIYKEVQHLSVKGSKI